MSRIKQKKSGNTNYLEFKHTDNSVATLGYDGTQFLSSTTFEVPNGTAAIPTLRGAATNSGIYFGSGCVYFSTAGSERGSFDGQGDLNVGNISIGNGGTGQIVGQKVAVVSITADATYALSATESGTLFCLEKADGITFTLPAAVVGLTYEFFVRTSVTSNNYGIDTDGTDNFEGCVLNVDKDQTYSSTEALQIFCKANGTPTHIDMNGGTTGGLLGSRLRVTAVTADRWMVEGIIHGDGNLATIFS